MSCTYPVYNQQTNRSRICGEPACRAASDRCVRHHVKDKNKKRAKDRAERARQRADALLRSLDSQPPSQPAP